MTVYKDLGEGGVVLNDTSQAPIIKDDVPFCGKDIKKVVTKEVDANDS